MNDIKQRQWILAGYEIFAKEGPGGLKVESLSKIVNKSKSSFYNYFPELEIFIEELLKYHLERAQIIANLEENCRKIDPDLIDILIENKTDLLFNRMLRVHRDNELYKKYLEKSNELVGLGFIKLWSRELGLNQNLNLARSVLNHSLDNFYLQITEDKLTYNWLSSYFKDIEIMIVGIKKSI